MWVQTSARSSSKLTTSSPQEQRNSHWDLFSSRCQKSCWTIFAAKQNENLVPGKASLTSHIRMAKSATNKPCDDFISVEVAFAACDKQTVARIELPVNATARQAVEQSGLAAQFLSFDFGHAPLGIFGTKVPDNHILENNDRVEVYRPLSQSAPESRRQRARLTKNKN